jgi:serine/threonine-protein kinase
VASTGNRIRLRLPESGQILNSKYRIGEKVSSGTYGVVYHAFDLTSSEGVAVKCLLPSAATSDAVVRRFEREIMVIRELTHPNIISVFDSGFSDGCLYYVMEYLDGEDLGARLRLGALSPKGAAMVTIQVLLALEEAHAHDIIHRDLKPENIFLQSSSDGRVRIRVLDFGIAKIVGERAETVERLTLNNEACGTPNYMAPELVTGGKVGAWTDIYALALIAWEMLTAQVAIAGASFIETLRRQITYVPPMPDGLDPALAEVLNKALSKAAAERYQSAGEMRLALTQALQAMP